MAYDQVGIINIALLRIGANIITDVDDNTANAIKAKAVWDYIFDELMSVRDWRFAKIRAILQKSATVPGYAYQFAYPLPADFLRLTKTRQATSKGINPLVYSVGYWYPYIDPTGYSRYSNYDPPVFPAGMPYIIESLPDGTLCLFTDYDNSTQDLYINYIQKITDYSKCTPTFINCLADRLGAELAIAITEDQNKVKLLYAKYSESLNSAEAVNESADYIEDESGSTDWENAGR